MHLRSVVGEDSCSLADTYRTYRRLGLSLLQTERSLLNGCSFRAVEFPLTEILTVCLAVSYICFHVWGVQKLMWCIQNIRRVHVSYSYLPSKCKQISCTQIAIQVKNSRMFRSAQPNFISKMPVLFAYMVICVLAEYKVRSRGACLQTKSA